MQTLKYIGCCGVKKGATYRQAIITTVLLIKELGERPYNPISQTLPTNGSASIRSRDAAQPMRREQWFTARLMLPPAWWPSFHCFS